jgi:NAD(P)-dependent dehydrogenase (short-subunit alcohol dehydrogenase family)
MYDRVVVITGASDGIGKAAAALFFAKRMDGC